jgi:hypothetical protein
VIRLVGKVSGAAQPTHGAVARFRRPAPKTEHWSTWAGGVAPGTDTAPAHAAPVPGAAHTRGVVWRAGACRMREGNQSAVHRLDLPSGPGAVFSGCR